MREDQKAYDFEVIPDVYNGPWFGIVVRVPNANCGPWHQEGCDSSLIVGRLMKLVRGMTGIARAGCMANEHTSLHLLIGFTGEIEVVQLTKKINDLVAGMFEYSCG